MMEDYQLYKKSIEQGFWIYWSMEERPGHMLDSSHGQGRLPVFEKEFADQNVLMKPGATDEENGRFLGLIPDGKRHKWFRSMSSSQALALSFFGNLAVHGQLDWLRDLKDDDGELVFGTADLSAHSFSMEHEVSVLNEPRSTSLDVFFSGRYRVAVECKLSEPEFGPCSRPRAKDPEKHCEGSYSIQGGRINRCSLTESSIKYWDYVPHLFKWSANEDYEKCPLRYNYQLVRNILAACVREDGTISHTDGHAVLVYDKRNPAFNEGGNGAQAFSFTKEALNYKQNLRKVSWQKICAHVGKKRLLDWLLKGVKDKYGIESVEIM